LLRLQLFDFSSILSDSHQSSLSTMATAETSLHPPNLEGHGRATGPLAAPVTAVALLLLLILLQSLVQQPPLPVLLRQRLVAPLPPMRWQLPQLRPCPLPHPLRLFRPHSLEPLVLQLLMLGLLGWSRSRSSQALYDPRLDMAVASVAGSLTPTRTLGLFPPVLP
jgi:hypothetical protein